MLTFLRKIRKSLIESGSARNYLLYAIGEVALVVVGIMIALQVNNWNNNQNTIKEIQVSYQKIILDIDNDISRFQRLDSILMFRIKIAIEISHLLVKENTISDIQKMRSFRRLGNNPLEFTDRTYQSMVNSGQLTRLTNNDLIASISEYYQFLENSQEFMFVAMGNANRNVRDQATLFPFHYILSTSDSVFILPSKALNWMNEPNSATFQAVQFYLSFYLRQHAAKRQRLSRIMEMNRRLNQQLTEYLFR